MSISKAATLGNHPIKWFPIHGRSILSLNGSAALSFLDGIMTANISHQSSAPSDPRSLSYGLFLNAQGKCISDAFVFGSSPRQLYLDIPEHSTQTLLKHLKLYKLKTDVEITECKTTNVYFSDPSIRIPDNGPVFALSSFDDFDALSEYLNVIPPKIADISLPDQNKDIIGGLDPRSHLMGWRSLQIDFSSSESTKIHPSDSPQPKSQVDNVNYESHRISCGIPEWREFADSINPLENNLDWIHGVSLNKGCYLGQEPVSRAFHKGVLRKRVVQVSQTNNNPQESFLDVGSEIYTHLPLSQLGSLVPSLKRKAIPSPVEENEIIIPIGAVTSIVTDGTCVRGLAKVFSNVILTHPPKTSEYERIRPPHDLQDLWDEILSRDPDSLVDSPFSKLFSAPGVSVSGSQYFQISSYMRDYFKSKLNRDPIVYNSVSSNLEFFTAPKDLSKRYPCEISLPHYWPNNFK